MNIEWENNGLHNKSITKQHKKKLYSVLYAAAGAGAFFPLQQNIYFVSGKVILVLGYN